MYRKKDTENSMYHKVGKVGKVGALSPASSHQVTHHKVKFRISDQKCTTQRIRIL